MAINPAAQSQPLNNPTARANELNDPQFSNEQGYFPYDLTHQEFISPRFGEITPTLNLDTVGGDRFVHQDNVKTILNQINGNFLSTVNQYVDSFYVPLRSLYPTNYEKLIPNPTKGQDLPNAALPQFPIAHFVAEYLNGSILYQLLNDGDTVFTGYLEEIKDLVNFTGQATSQQRYASLFMIGRMTLLATVFSRGQLLDYLGCQFDTSDNLTASGLRSYLQTLIDRYFTTLYDIVAKDYGYNVISSSIDTIDLDLTSNEIDFVLVEDNPDFYFNDLSSFRSAISDIFEKGLFPIFDLRSYSADATVQTETNFTNAYNDLYDAFIRIFGSYYSDMNIVNSESNPFQSGYISLVKPLAYQQIVAQYYSNNTVDNIYNSDLFMQLLRSVMFPSTEDGITSEPTFLYNGVTTEYDYISYGACYESLLRDRLPGNVNRQYVWMTLMLLIRRSLRYGDYFSTARPNMLAVGQLSINVEDGKVSPIDITKNLLMQRYLNAANYIGSGFLQYYASIFGVTPSDTGTYPRFIAHRKIELQNNLVENTADNQGYQTTNLVGYSDDTAFDVFIDDFGVILSLTSYDVLPVYKSGIDNSFHFSDRFDYFNPMLQGIGDQAIYLSELIGDPSLRTDIFGYTMRNAEYKYKKSRAHGAFVNSLPGFMLGFNVEQFMNGAVTDFHIDPDFIRDKPAYLDPVVPQMTGISPGEYYHFIVAVTNVVQCARKIQATPPVLF